MASDYHQAHGAGLSEKWRRNWLRKLELYPFPIIGDLSAGEIQTDEVVRVL
ncbi:hypothetical protein D3C77_676850 [compost metagenome]